MANRIFEMGGIWAKDAPNLPSGPPVAGATYANSTINESTINQAWPFTNIVASNNTNEVLKRMTLLLTQMEKQGVLSYSELTDYGVGALVIGSNDFLYRCLITNGPNVGGGTADPVGSPTVWKNSSVGGITSITTTGLVTSTPDEITDTGIIDVPASSIDEATNGVNETTAMTPLRTRQSILTSPLPTVATKGVVVKSTTAQNELGTAVNVYPDVVGVAEMINKLSIPGLWEKSGSHVYRETGNVGVGVEFPDVKFDVNGQIKIRGGNPGDGKVLISDINGVGSWNVLPASNLSTIVIEEVDTSCFLIFVDTVSGERILKSSNALKYNSSAKTVTMDNLSVVNSLETQNIKITSGTLGLDKVLYSDENGVGIWKDLPAASAPEITNEATDETCSILFVNEATGIQELHSNVGIRFDSLNQIIILSNTVTTDLSTQTIKITGGIPGLNKVLTSDGIGVGTWEELPAGGVGTVTEVTGAGLITGGPITSSGTLTVTPSTNTQGEAGTDTTTAMTPASTRAAISTYGIPGNTKSSAYTTVLSDNGKHIYHPVADTTARIFTIAGNVAYPVGAVITFINDVDAGQLTIAINSGTLVWMEDGSTGSRIIEAQGIATALKVSAARWVISGLGVT